VNLNDRDKKLATIIFPLAIVAAFWFLVLAPKRTEATSLGDQLATVEAERDAAVAEAGALEGAKTNYAKDYETVVRLGKAIPGSVDMPSLLVQLDRAAEGTDIRFVKVAAGPRTAAPAPAAPAPEGSAPAAEAGGAPAETAPGTAAESANEAAQTSDEASAARGADAATTVDPAVGATTAAAPGLDTVPLDFSFSGGFFELADFFHEMKRFVYVANRRVRVQGRLMQINGFSFEATSFPTIKAEVQATVYLAPKSEGATAGANPSGPSLTEQASAAPETAAAPPAPPAGATPVDTSGGIQ